jgi:hypothetical protein
MPNHDIWDELELVGRGEHLDEEMFEFLSAYVDGECSAKERRLVEAYLAESSAARELLADLRAQSAWASEEMQDPPAWLRGAILEKARPGAGFSWKPIAACSLAGAAAALAAFALMPHEQILPATGKERVVATLLPPPDVLAQHGQRKQERRPDTAKANLTFVSRKVEPKSRIESSGGAKKVSLPEEIVANAGSMPQEIQAAKVDETPVTDYDVAEYGNGRLEAKQPDLVDSSTGLQEFAGPKTPAPAVLPDAREKLRDKVRKMNQEKLELDEEKAGR